MRQRAEVVKGRVQDATHVTVLIDVDAGEERLIEEAAPVVWARPVDPVMLQQVAQREAVVLGLTAIELAALTLAVGSATRRALR